jgi:SAM-dependent methyltransferase
MSIELGARAGMICPDDTTFAFLEGRPRAPKGVDWERALDHWRSLDSDPGAVASVRAVARRLAPALPESNFRAEPIEQMTFPDAFADVVLASAVLHFARDDAQFDGMVREMWRVLKPGGLLFCRLASDIGMETRVEPIAGRRHLLPDGSERYLVDQAMLLDLTRVLGGQLVDPLKTTIVQDARCMTTWVVRKHP